VYPTPTPHLNLNASSNWRFPLASVRWRRRIASCKWC